MVAEVGLAYAPVERVVLFLTVWGGHAGSYGGATWGTVIAVIKVTQRREVHSFAAEERTN